MYLDHRIPSRILTRNCSPNGLRKFQIHTNLKKKKKIRNGELLDNYMWEHYVWSSLRVGPKSQFRNGTIGAQNLYYTGIPCIIKVEHISKSHQDRTPVSEI